MRPKRHKMLVEITDMHGTISARQIRWMMEMFVRDGIIAHDARDPQGRYGQFVNVQVKDPRRVAAAERRKK